MDERTREQIEALWRNGYSVREIAAFVGLGKSRVHQITAALDGRPPIDAYQMPDGSLRLLAEDLDSDELRDLLERALRHTGRRLRRRVE